MGDIREIQLRAHLLYLIELIEQYEKYKTVWPAAETHDRWIKLCNAVADIRKMFAL